ncbi:MAG TPA: MlaD family protein [Gaiellaceae bacterium]|nr:MlaD family protein [Gaiellaceae bacterium]
MRRRVDDFVVGLVTLAGVAVIVLAVMWMKQVDVGDKRPSTVARFRDVGNVRVGNGVFIRGVRAGRVEGIELADGGWVRVKMSLDPEVRLPPDPVVVLNASSLFGEWQASVMARAATPPDPDLRHDLAEASGEDGVLPGATLPDVAQLTAVAGRIAGDMASVADRFEVAFTDTAARELRASIANVASLTKTLDDAVRRQSATIDTVALEARTGATEIARASASVRRTLARVDSSTSSGEIGRVVAHAERTAAQLDSATADLRALTGRLSESQLRLASALARSDSVVAKVNAGQGTLGMLVNDGALYRNADSLVRELRALAADVRGNPKRYVSLKVF